MSKIYLTIAEMARRARRAPRKVQRLIDEGRLPGAEFVESLQQWAIPEEALKNIVPYPGRAVQVAGEVYLPMTEFAQRTGVSRQRISQLVLAGRLPSRRLDGRVFIAEKWLGPKEQDET